MNTVSEEMKILLTYWYGVPSMPVSRVENIKHSGFKYISLHWCDEYEKANGKKSDILKACDKRGLKIEVFHLPFEEAHLLWQNNSYGERVYNTYKKCIRDANKYRVKYVVMHLNSNNKSIKKDINIGMDRIKKLLKYAEELDVNIAFENLTYQDYLDRIEDVLYRYKNACLCFDVGHHNIKYSNFVMNHRDKIEVMHIHDNFGQKDEHLIPFMGNVNWNNIYEIIDDVFDHCVFVFEVQSNKYIDEESFLKNAYNASKKIKIQFCRRMKQNEKN